MPNEISVDCSVSLVSHAHGNMLSISSSQTKCLTMSSESLHSCMDNITCEAVPLASYLDDNTDRTLSWVSPLPDESPESISTVVSSAPQVAPATSFGSISVMSDEATVAVTVTEDECHSDSGSLESASTVTSAQAHSQSSGVPLTTLTPVAATPVAARQVRSSQLTD